MDILHDLKCYVKESDEFKKKQKKAIKDFFRDKFREDMIMEISEEERQEEIREWEKRLCGLENWASRLENPCCDL